jgi:hypothetical protein
MINEDRHPGQLQWMTIKNFPFPTLRDGQSYVLNEIEAAFGSDSKYRSRYGFWEDRLSIGCLAASLCFPI